MKYTVFYDDKLQYYRIMQPALRYRINEIPILKTSSYKVAVRTVNELNGKLLEEEEAFNERKTEYGLY